MRVSFSPSALLAARSAAGLTLAAVGRSLGVSRQCVQQFECGDRQPNDAMVERLCEILGVAPAFLHQPFVFNPTDRTIYFRSLRATGKRSREKAEASLRLFQDLVQRLGSLIAFPRVPLPCGDGDSLESIERSARECRVALGVGIDAPIANLTRAVECAGIFVTEFADVDPGIDAFSCRAHPHVIVRGAKGIGSRCRFDVAHELGHLVMHAERAHGDEGIETQAHRFAGALLLPPNSFAREFPRTDRWMWPALFRLKMRWQVSVSAMIMRAAQLGLISEDRKRNALIQMSARGWLRAPEPEEPLPEVPELLVATFREFYRVRGMRPGDLLDSVCWNLDMLRRVVAPAVYAEIESIGDPLVLRLEDHRKP